NVRRHETCEGCRGTGAAPGKAPVACRTCGGRGQVRYQQGFFSMARTCPTCQGAGSVITDPCAKCKAKDGCCGREWWRPRFPLAWKMARVFASRTMGRRAHSAV